MPKDRYFINHDLKKDLQVCIQGQESVHISLIMRKRQNEEVEIINGKGFLARAKILDISKNKTTLRIENVFFEEEKKQKIILIQSIIKPDKTDLVLEKCTELGIDKFLLLPSINAQKIKISKNRLDRMQNIIIAAIKQSGRLYLPKIDILTSIKDLEKLKGHFFLGSLDKNCKKLIDAYKKNDENIHFIIGPESGFTKEEIHYLENEINAEPVKLNENILRSETAAICAASIAFQLHN